MVKQIKLTYTENFSCEYTVDDRLITKSMYARDHVFAVNHLPCHVKIRIQPYKIKPIVRIDDIMVNYGLAEITPWDHMLEFKLDMDFFDRYFANIVESKIKYLNLEKSEAHKRIGHDDLSDLVRQIEEKIQ
jgi:hypothetical protein